MCDIQPNIAARLHCLDCLLPKAWTLEVRNSQDCYVGHTKVNTEIWFDAGNRQQGSCRHVSALLGEARPLSPPAMAQILGNI